MYGKKLTKQVRNPLGQGLKDVSVSGAVGLGGCSMVMIE